MLCSGLVISADVGGMFSVSGSVDGTGIFIENMNFQSRRPRQIASQAVAKISAVRCVANLISINMGGAGRSFRDFRQ